MALGAKPDRIVRLVIREVFGPITLGIIAGGITLLPLSRVMRTYLFGVSPADPVSLLVVTLVLLLSAVLAAYVPARRAATIDPLVALRTS
jgi:putative ABC transport system permease protein